MCETTSEAMRRQAALGKVGDFDSERICSISSSGMFIGGASFLGEALPGPLPYVKCGAMPLGGRLQERRLRRRRLLGTVACERRAESARPGPGTKGTSASAPRWAPGPQEEGREGPSAAEGQRERRAQRAQRAQRVQERPFWRLWA